MPAKNTKIKEGHPKWDPNDRFNRRPELGAFQAGNVEILKKPETVNGPLGPTTQRWRFKKGAGPVIVEQPTPELVKERLDKASKVKGAQIYQPHTGAEHGAFVCFVSEVADDLEQDEEFTEIANNFPMSGSELTETIPAEFATANVDIKPYVDVLVPKAQQVIDDMDKQLSGKTTMQALADEFGDKVWTSAILQSMGHGVSITDDPGVSAKLKELGLGDVHPQGHIMEGAGDDQAWQALTKYASQGD